MPRALLGRDAELPLEQERPHTDAAGPNPEPNPKPYPKPKPKPKPKPNEESFGGLGEDGLPALDAAGEPLSKSARKKLAKQQARSLVITP